MTIMLDAGKLALKLGVVVCLPFGLLAYMALGLVI